MIARLEHLAWSWAQGAPVRAGELDRLLGEVRALARAARADEIHALVDRVDGLVSGLDRARRHAESELAAIPGRKRAMRAHACIRTKAPGLHLRRRA